MSVANFQSNARVAGREPIMLVRMTLDFCANTYGQSPCSAAIGVTGDQKCFNTRPGCQDPENYNLTTQEYLFYEPRGNIPAGLVGFPFIRGFSGIRESELDSDGGLGKRSSISITFSDHPHHDIGVDPYVSERDYDPTERGSFWGKFLSRNRYYVGRKLEVIWAHIVDGAIDFDDAIINRYIIEKFDGPTANGSVTVTAKDPLKLADGDRAKCPEPSLGSLDDDITEGQTSFSVAADNSSEYPTGNAGSGNFLFKVRVGDEIMGVQTNSFSGGFHSFSNVTRGIDKTEADEHDDGDTVQLVFERVGEFHDDLLEELLTDCAGIDPSLIPKSAWEDTRSDVGFVFGTQISEPTGVDELIRHLCHSAGVFIWWDTRDQQINMRALTPTPPLNEIDVLDDDKNLIADSVQIARAEGRRKSRILYSYGLLNSTEDIEGDYSNYSATRVDVDLSSEGADRYDSPRIRNIWARWTARGNAAAAETIARKTLFRFRDTPFEASFKLDTKDSEYWVGRVIGLRHRNLQDDTGGQTVIPFLITQAKQGEDTLAFKAVGYRVPPIDLETQLIVANDRLDGYNVRQEYEENVGPIGSDAVTVNLRVNNDVLVTDLGGGPAMLGGGLPAGSVVKFENLGRVHGRSGIGGNGAPAFASFEGGEWITSDADGSAGGDGSIAIVMSEDWEIDNENGEIFGGAGAGGGGASLAGPDVSYGGGGGGGGQWADSAYSASGGLGGSAGGNASDTQSGQDGGDGSAGSAGSGGGSAAGDGGNGALWGQNGSPGSDTATRSGGAGGVGGDAIHTNGNSLTWVDQGDRRGDVV